MALGFVGTGVITEAIIRGINRTPDYAEPIIISPRSTDRAQRLATEFTNVRIAEDNQDVVVRSDIICLAVRPQIAEEIVKSLKFWPNQKIVSFIATLAPQTLSAWLNRELTITRAIPLPFVEHGIGATVICPPDRTVSEIFKPLGTVIEVSDESALDLFFSASALMGTYFGVLEAASGWLTRNGLKERDAKAYLAHLFAGLSHSTGDANFSHLRTEFSTKGGLNEQLFRVFSETGGQAALEAGLDSVLERLRGNRS